MDKFHDKSCTYITHITVQVLINKKKAIKEKSTYIQKHHDRKISTTKPTQVTGEQCGVPF